MSGGEKHTGLLDRLKIRRHALLAVLSSALFVLASCGDDAITDPNQPRNLVTGVADGVSFASYFVGTVKDSNDVFLMAGSMGPGGSFLAAFSGREEMEYPVAEDGALVALTNYLNDLIAADSFFIDTSALQTVFSDSAQLLPEGKSFMFFIPEETPFFSRRGNITLSSFDATINRIYGTFEGEFINAEEGPKYINASFEDVFYIDCPQVDECGL